MAVMPSGHCYHKKKTKKKNVLSTVFGGVFDLL